MNILSWEEVKKRHVPCESPVALSIGVFDGLHTGHRLLLSSITKASKEYEPTVLTFRENPAKLILGKQFRGNIMTLQQKLDGFLRVGIGTVILIDFSSEFSKLSGKEFIYTVYKHINVKYLALGQNFRCGYKAETNADMIKNFCKEYDCTVQIYKPVIDEGEPVSSTKIRELIKAGEIGKANLHLYKPYSLDITESFPRKRGNQVSIAIQAIDQIIPRNGTYSATIYNNTAVDTTISIDEKTITWEEPINFTTKEILIKQKSKDKE